MPTTIRFRRDGVVMHMHPVRGAAHPEGRWHQPWESHPSDRDAHAREDAEHPYARQGSSDYPVSWERRSLYLTDAQVETYYRALTGGRPADYFRPRGRAAQGQSNWAGSIRTPSGMEVPLAVPVTDRRFGVEMECITNIEEFVAAAGRRGIRVQRRGYSHETPAAGTWMMTPDGSLSYTGGAAGFGTIEIVSPILRGEAGIQALKLICEAHAEVGTMVNRTCGLHVHHDATTLTVEEAKRIAHSYHNIQGIINSLVAPSRRGGNTYCNPFSTGDLRVVDEATTIGSMANGIGRYKNVNIGHAYHAHKTIEFRQHQGSVDFQKISAWIQLGQALFTHATNGMTLQPTTDIDTMGAVLGLPSSLTEYFKDRKLKLAAGGL